MTQPNGDAGFELLVALRENATEEATRLDAEASRMEARAADLRFRAFALRSVESQRQRVMDSREKLVTRVAEVADAPT